MPATGGLRHNLPADLSSFVGRVRELAEVAEALEATRLLTLTGAGGCGKSRLALRAAADALDGFPDGVWLVELAALTDAAMVAPTLLQALGVRPLPGQSDLEAAVSYLAPRRSLILLDNCEHVLAEAGRVVETLLRGCPMVRVLATSREPSGTAGEADWRVPSLSLPESTEAVSELEGSDAIRLFVERAAKMRPAFSLSQANAAAVVRICRELDGMPLAIELAAARLRMLSVEQIAEGLGDRFRLLTARGRLVVPRHRTLRASVEWSYELLSVQERRLFGRLGVFVDGFTLEAAEAVGAADGIARDEVLDLLTSLVDKSLVQAEERDSTVRYRLLETVRHYALERLDQAGETEATRDRHRDHYVELAEQKEPGVFPGIEFLRLLDPEAANFTAAIDWAASTDARKALRLCVALMVWWRFRGYFAQGDANIRRALDAGTSEDALRALALVGRAHLLTYSGVVQDAIPAAQEALAAAEQVGDDLALSAALLQAGTLTLFADPIGSRPTLERAREHAVRSGRDWAIMGTTVCLAFSYSHQDAHETARPLFEEVRQRAESTDNEEMRAWYWLGIAWAEQAAGAYESSRTAAERALISSRTVGDLVTEVAATWLLAAADSATGEPEKALRRLAPVRKRALRLGGAFTLPMLDVGAAQALVAMGRLNEAHERLQELIASGAWGIASVLARAYVGAAEVLRGRGSLDEAAEAAQRAGAVADGIQNRLVVAQSRMVQGRIAGAREGWREAQQLFHDALTATSSGGFRPELAEALEGFAAVAEALQDLPTAARLLGAATSLRRESGSIPWPHQRDEIDALAFRLRAGSDAADFDRWVAEGESMSAEDAVRYVQRSRGARGRPATGWDSLTPTEMEVAGHAADGLTNPQIAERMFISRGTVRTHLSHIFSKLGVRNRSELTAEVIRRRSVTRA